MIREINGRWICDRCGYEFSAMMGDDEIPNKCPGCAEDKLSNRLLNWKGTAAHILDLMELLKIDLEHNGECLETDDKRIEVIEEAIELITAVRRYST